MPLGRQCLTCKKRRVKCGSEEPHCKKCDKDGHVCLGYAKALIWRRVQPNHKTKASQKNEDDSLGVELAAVGLDRELLAKSQNLVPKLHLPSIDEHTYQFAQVVDYFNNVTMPDMSAIHGQNKSITSVKEWLEAPAILRSNLIVSVLRTQSIRAGWTLPELYMHRGRAIKTLSIYLQTPNEHTHVGSLVALMGILQQEIHFSPVDGFAIHLDAARKVVETSGGIQNCLQMWPVAFNMIIMFIQADIVSMTTTHLTALNPTHTASQHSYLTTFNDSEIRLLDSPLPCPLPILRSIVHINHLRALSASLGGATSMAWKAKYLDIAKEIYEFDALNWSCTIPVILEAPTGVNNSRADATNEWTHLARCYQAATMIYLIESTKFQRVLEAYFEDANQLSSALIECAHEQLQLNLLRLFSSYPARDSTPERPTLWRFTTWPLMIYAYDLTLRGNGSSYKSRILGNQTTVVTLFEELREISMAINSQSILEGASLFEKLAADRLLSTKKWDEVFERSIVFYL